MRIHIFGEPYTEEQRLLITPFIEAVEEVALQYEFARSLDMSVTYYGEVGLLPKLLVRFKWAPEGKSYMFEASITLEDIKELGARGMDDFDIYVYHFARLMISSLALSLKNSERTLAIDQSAWQGGRRG